MKTMMTKALDGTPEALAGKVSSDHIPDTYLTLVKTGVLHRINPCSWTK